MAIEKHDTSGSAENTLVPVSEKYTLTIKEAAAYFNIGSLLWKQVLDYPSEV